MGFTYKHLRNGVNQGAAVQWKHRLRRIREHPNYKTMTPSYEEIEKLVTEVEVYRIALNKVWGWYQAEKWISHDLRIKLSQMARKGVKMWEWLKTKPQRSNP
jgi:hypothetical protein